MALTALAGRPAHTGPRQTATAWLLLSPFIVIFLPFTAVPVVASLAMSLTDIRSTDLRNPFGVDVIGFANYLDLLSDPAFRRAALNTLYVVVVGVPLTMAVGFALALVLDRGIRRFRGAFRAVFYAPVVANVVSVALIWQYAFNQNGTVNTVLAAAGLAGPNWLGPNWLGPNWLGPNWLGPNWLGPNWLGAVGLAATSQAAQNVTDYGLVLAGAVVVMLPVLILFVLLQRYFVQGIAGTGLK